MARTVRPELVPFYELNKAEKAGGKSGKTMSDERRALILKYFPQATKLDWRAAFKDPDVWGRFLKDLYKPDSSESPQRARERLRQFTGNDYSYEPFRDAFNALAGSRSVRHLANKLELSTQIVWKLKNGRKEPDLRMIEQIAEKFGKDPAYFVEYRIAYVLAAFGDQLERSPETSVDLYKRLRRKNGQ